MNRRLPSVLFFVDSPIECRHCLSISFPSGINPLSPQAQSLSGKGGISGEGMTMSANR
jgi:hypothetical protein